MLRFVRGAHAQEQRSGISCEAKKCGAHAERDAERLPNVQDEDPRGCRNFQHTGTAHIHMNVSFRKRLGFESLHFQCS